jgi:hypothetical protein
MTDPPLTRTCMAAARRRVLDRAAPFACAVRSLAMNRFRFALALSMLALAGGLAVAQTPGTRLRGTVERMEGSTLDLKAADGREVKVALAPGASSASASAPSRSRTAR